MRTFRVFGLVLALGLAAAAFLPAQKREDFLQIQRDVAQLQDQVRQLQKTQDEKMALLEGLIRQLAEGQAKTNASLSTMQAGITETLGQQQQKLVAPVAALSKEVEQMAGDFNGVKSNVGELSGQLRRLDDKLADISSSVRTMAAAATQPAAPPPAPTVTVNEPTPPPGVTAESLFENGRRDFSTKNDSLALKEFVDYVTYFPKTENAPRAQYYVGQIYERAEQYDDAVKAFNAVIERFEPNPWTPEAAYMKAVNLMKGKHKAEAIEEFQDFINTYPQSEHVTMARQNLRALGATAAPKTSAAKPRRAQ